MFLKTSDLGANNKEGRTKNVVKNITKAFGNYLETHQHKGREYKQPHTEIQRVITKNKFNNNVIRMILHAPHILPLFKAFLEHKALEEIDRSKIKDKETHYEAIKVYITMAEEALGEVPLAKTKVAEPETEDRSSPVIKPMEKRPSTIIISPTDNFKGSAKKQLKKSEAMQ